MQATMCTLYVNTRNLWYELRVVFTCRLSDAGMRVVLVMRSLRVVLVMRGCVYKRNLTCKAWHTCTSVVPKHFTTS